MNRRQGRLRDEPTESEASSSNSSSSGGADEINIPIASGNLELWRPTLLRQSQTMCIYPLHSIFVDIRQTLTEIGGQPLLERFSRTVMGRFISVRRGLSANNALHFLLAREVMNNELITQHKRWFFVAGRILQFTPQAFCLVFGLTFGPANFDPTEDHRIPVNGLHAKHFQKAIKSDQLRKAFTSKEMGADPEDYIKVANLLVFYFWLLCRDKAMVDNWAWALFEDLDKWELFPWGAYTYLNLIDYIKHTGVADDQMEKRSYHFYGAVWALQIWSYEVIPHWAGSVARETKCPASPVS